jgi:hypothetical protein
MKLNAIQVLQFLGMIIMPIAIGSNTRDDAAGVVWSCVVIAILLVGVAIAEVAKAIAGPKSTSPRTLASPLPRHPMDQ